jgi:hypothetical protein
MTITDHRWKSKWTSDYQSESMMTKAAKSRWYICDLSMKPAFGSMSYKAGKAVLQTLWVGSEMSTMNCNERSVLTSLTRVGTDVGLSYTPISVGNTIGHLLGENLTTVLYAKYSCKAKAFHTLFILIYSVFHRYTKVDIELVVQKALLQANLSQLSKLPG